MDIIESLDAKEETVVICVTPDELRRPILASLGGGRIRSPARKGSCGRGVQRPHLPPWVGSSIAIGRVNVSFPVSDGSKRAAPAIPNAENLCWCASYSLLGTRFSSIHGMPPIV